MSSNYPLNQDNNGKQTDLLDRVCADLTPEQRARVRDLAIRLDIHRDDPLWLIALAIGQLQVLLQDSPQDLRLLFDTVEMELEEWAQAATTVLETTIKDAQNQQVLAHATDQLLIILTALGKSLNELVSFLQTQSYQSAFSNSSVMLGSLKQELTVQLQANSVSLQGFIRQEIAASLQHQSHANSPRISIWSDNTRLLWISLGANALLLLGGFSLWRTHTDTNQRVQWLWQHQQKIECFLGVLPKKSRQCRALL